MTSPGGRIEIRVDPDLRGFGNRLASGLTDSARTGVAAFASAAKVALLGAAVGIGAAGLVAAKSTLDIGREYEGQLNTLQAVSSATEAQMQSVGRTAKTLGSDLTLPATSAADAAAVMTELAKANFSVDQAQQAAKGSLQLAAAAQIEGAQAATIQANAINAYGLAASDATRVADVLANAANASSAEITDVADALAQAAAVAASANISIEDTATVLGILANNGIRGSDAGTLLKSALLALQSPSKQARDSMGELGLTAYDAQGNFVGLRSIFEQLQVAQGQMTQQQYEMATSTLFGSDAARLAGIAAREGGEGFDTMAGAIGREGAAAEVAAAKSRGLGGAIEAFKSQVETVQIDIFERAAPSLERLVRAAAERLPEVAESALETADDVVASFQEMAPRIGRALQARRDTVVAAWRQLGEPLVEGARDLADKGLDVVVESAERLSELAGDAVDTVEPLADSVGNLASSLAEAGGPLDTAGDLLGVAADAAETLLDVVDPLVGVVSGAVDVISDLPGPLQTAALGLVAFRVAGGRAGEWATSGLTGRMINPFVKFGQTVQMQMALADDSITRSEAFRGGVATALERQAPRVTGAWNQITGAYRGGVAEAQTAYTKYGLAVDGFSTRVSGLGRAAQSAGSVGIGGLRTAGAGLVSFLGGPWGVALAAGTLAVSTITNEMAESEAQVESWAQALITGGQAAARVQAEVQARRDAQFTGLVNPAQRDEVDTVGEVEDNYKDAKRAAEDYYRSLGPLEEAQARAAHWNSELSYRLKEYGAGSDEVAAAQRRFSYWSGVAADRQNDLDNATQSATGAMLAQTQAALAASDTSLVYRQQQNQLEQAIQSTTETLASSTATDLEKQAALLGLESQINTTAEAARQHALASSATVDAEAKAMEGDAAYLAQLMATATQLGTNTPAAIQQTIAALQGTVDKGALAAAQFNMLGLEIQEVPDSKTVIVSSTTPEQIALLESLGYKVTHLENGTVQITALTEDAETAINNLTKTRYVKVVLNEVSGTRAPSAGQRVPGLATGGYLQGPGTGTSDSILIRASNGEYMIRAAMTARSRAGLDAVNRGDWSAAASFFSTLAERQSRATIAAAAGSRAAATAGRYAAGGYITAQDRASATGVVTVPQRVTNIQNNLTATPALPTIDQLQRMQRKAEVLAGA